ncbi:hypothetical protein EMIHUDRAFT_434800 [Emiliania huxleyi CCMP1516]|uniref:Uncharacterized protein n=2 Tax=Emiliania huxleyi TaxID=2903 RepID=A0A0D3JYB1_EMIH1|nr:hypothetical protein EMIHUDRAFT_434800 [Emiliania huxleyi CCMP1516]EOD28496.1 hypothetical protein EMIHUDRAFT_434800 [Emiliania huxleyi CCMP1516]|eukprot:XP_005780925.1 hypothetical protein EMIHUDRAFT_434800 [Emiliania huxleyi CCMP1516]
MSERTSIPDEKTLERLRSDYGQAKPRVAPLVALRPEEPHSEPGCVTKAHRYFCGSVKATSYTMLALLSFAALFWIPMIWYVIIPAVLDMLVGATSINIHNATMSAPTETSMRVSAVVEINNAGPFGCDVDAFNATVHGPPEEGAPSGRTIGWMVVPPFTLKGNGPGVINPSTVMHVTDAAAFNRMAKRMLNGDAVPWRMTGESTVWSMGIPFPLSIDKETTFPPIQLTNYATSNLEMSHGNTTTNQLVIDADVSFYSASPMRLEGFGLLKAELYYDVSGNNPDLSPAERLKLAGPPLRAGHVKMGECHMYDYTVVQGMNTIKTRIYLDANYATGQSLGRWASEFDQTIVSVGPTNISPFIDGIWEGANDMPGSSITLYTATFVTADTLVKGYNPKTGEPCKVWDGGIDSCDRGSTVMGMNPFKREWFIKDIEYETYLEQEYEYSGTFLTKVIPGQENVEVPFTGGTTVGDLFNIPAVSFSCGRSNVLGRTFSKPGMWAGYPNHSPGVGLSYPPDDPNTTGVDENLQARLADAVIPVPPATVAADGTLIPSVYSFTMPVHPIPGTSVDRSGDGPCIWGLKNLNPFDCCMTTIFTAAACKAAESGKKQITVTSSGSAVMIVDGVELNISTSVRMPVTYTNDVLQFDAIPPDSYGALGHVVDAGFGCDDIEFTGVSA